MNKLQSSRRRRQRSVKF